MLRCYDLLTLTSLIHSTSTRGYAYKLFPHCNRALTCTSSSLFLLTTYNRRMEQPIPAKPNDFSRPSLARFTHHRLRGSASPVLTATGFVNGKGQYSTPHRIDTPQPITKIFVTGDYVGDPYGCAKLGAYPSMGGFWAHG